MKIKCLTKDAYMPTRGSEYSAGLDLYAVGDYELEPGGIAKVKTGIAIELPEGTFGGIYPRSGLATKKGLRLCNCVGVIDADYRGEVIVPIYNDSDDYREITEGERVAQLIVQPYIPVNLEIAYELSATDRGEGGFGSTGIK